MRNMGLITRIDVVDGFVLATRAWVSPSVYSTYAELDVDPPEREVIVYTLDQHDSDPNNGPVREVARGNLKAVTSALAKLKGA